MTSTRSQAAQRSPGFFGRHSNVYLYVPNLIGYARVAFALLGFALARTSPGTMIWAYLLSFVCDELDGRFARLLGQSSTLGAVLDMVTDRVATSCLLAVLCLFYPGAHLVFLAALGLDIFSHWFQMYATLAGGAASHKDTNSSSFIVRAYYRHRLFMGFCCVCCEVLYLALYALAWPQYRAAGVLRLDVLPGGAALLAVLPACIASLFLTPDAAGLPAAALVALLALPGTLIKQAVNVVQLRAAAAALADLDARRSG